MGTLGEPCGGTLGGALQQSGQSCGKLLGTCSKVVGSLWEHWSKALELGANLWEPWEPWGNLVGTLWSKVAGTLWNKVVGTLGTLGTSQEPWEPGGNLVGQSCGDLVEQSCGNLVEQSCGNLEPWGNLVEQSCGNFGNLAGTLKEPCRNLENLVGAWREPWNLVGTLWEPGGMSLGAALAFSEIFTKLYYG